MQHQASFHKTLNPLVKLLELFLRADDRIVDQETLTAELGIRLSLLEQHIDQLRANALEITTRHKQFRLEEWTTALEHSCLERFVISSDINKKLPLKIDLYDQVESTNTLAKALQIKDDTWHYILAKEQTKGRGRQGRTWLSGQDGGLYMSLALRSRLNLDKLQVITLLVSIAVKECLDEFLSSQVDIKWPNDILVDGLKLCGILVESVIKDNQVQLVIGIGLNINQASFPLDLKDKASSMAMESGLQFDPNYISVRLMHYLDAVLSPFLKTGDMDEALLSSYKAACITIGQDVFINQEETILKGYCLDVEKDGRLKIRLNSGEIVCFNSGEVQVRGLLGYT